jgi:hypothetical protein
VESEEKKGKGREDWGKRELWREKREESGRVMKGCG